MLVFYILLFTDLGSEAYEILYFRVSKTTRFRHT